MEDILDLYEEAYDPKRPNLCMDERPCQLINDVLVPIPMKSGKAMKYDYEYERKGTCCVFIVCEPLTGTPSRRRGLAICGSSEATHQSGLCPIHGEGVRDVSRSRDVASTPALRGG
jgi:hypothetical protein